ncbi:VapA/VapB family virulence-associated protein [Xenorhabdus miraniensis]|uniref:Uncharacterized protein n=1 Tax=Xenorhabdus miraniensis TaxID=351674 RepID=A0A2D0JNK5_9GAMM|nr:VapA/VapB family virulence-associated protein [Xenorhabdus miraniensis]PHM47865.1 hypothetical protein Xmir_02948 [Xenorhabdus miraniensis]
MKNEFSTENRLAAIKNLEKIMDGKLDKDIINDIQEKLLIFSIEPYLGEAHIDSAIFYTTLTLSLDIGKKFHGKSWGVESLGETTYHGGILTSDFNELITESKKFTMADTAGGISILFLTSSFKPVGYFEGIGLPMIGAAAGSGSWS